jgi:hypothetical protein
MTDGTTLTGDVISYNDNGIVFRVDVDKYSDCIPWTKFSQDALKQLSLNPKIRPLAEPFIESPPVQRTKKGEVKVHEVTRLELPARQSLIKALCSSSVGLMALLLIYAANVYAGYEIAFCRGQSIPLVMGVSVVLPIIGPIIFLAKPAPPVVPEAAPQAEAPAQTFTVPGPAQPVASGIHIVDASWQGKASPSEGSVEPQIFQRGQFTFNRRFFETKFSGFFGVIRRDAEKNQVLTVKTARAQLVVERISRIAANEMHVEVSRGGAKQEVMVPFADILEVQLAPKSA